MNGKKNSTKSNIIKAIQNNVDSNTHGNKSLNGNDNRIQNLYRKSIMGVSVLIIEEKARMKSKSPIIYYKDDVRSAALFNQYRKNKAVTQKQQVKTIEQKPFEGNEYKSQGIKAITTPAINKKEVNTDPHNQLIQIDNPLSKNKSESSIDLINFTKDHNNM